MAIHSVLVVDDSRTEQMHLTDLLHKMGMHVRSAGSAEDAYRQLEAEKPDLILMDVVMPGMNGYQATRTISREETTRHIPIIMCTSKDQETDKIWGMRQGAQGYLVKPLDPIELLAKVASM